MAYTAAVAQDVRDRFPTFAAVADAPINYALADAALVVDDEWLSQADYTQGILLYAAHILTLDGFGSGAEAQMAQAGALGFDVMKSGALTLQRTRQQVEAQYSSVLDQTTFGKRFREILMRNRGGPFAAVAVT